MKRLPSRTNLLLDSIQSYFEKSIGEGLALVRSKVDIEIPDIAQWDRGYRDVLQGMRSYPAALLICRSRKHDESFFTTYTLTLGVLIKSPDPVVTEEVGHIYEDVIEDALGSDPTLGGCVTDTSTIWSIDSDVLASTYLISVDFDVDLDRGGFIYEEQLEESSSENTENKEEIGG